MDETDLKREHQLLYFFPEVLKSYPNEIQLCVHVHSELHFSKSLTIHVLLILLVLLLDIDIH